MQDINEIFDEIIKTQNQINAHEESMMTLTRMLESLEISQRLLSEKMEALRKSLKNSPGVQK